MTIEITGPNQKPMALDVTPDLRVDFRCFFFLEGDCRVFVWMIIIMILIFIISSSSSRRSTRRRSGRSISISITISMSIIFFLMMVKKKTQI